MRVIHLTSVHPWNDNRIFHKECVSLAQEGFDVYLIAPATEEKVVNGVHIIPLSEVRSRLLRILIQPIRLFFKGIQLEGDIYHFHDPEIIPVGIILRFLGKKVIYDIHENVSASLKTRPYLLTIFQQIIPCFFRYFENIFVRLFSTIVTARSDIAENFKHKNLIVLRNFPIVSSKLEIKDKNYPKDKYKIIYAGRMTPIRGIIELIDAFENVENLELLLLGKFYSNKFKQQCMARPGWKNTKYLGLVNPDQVLNIIRDADVGIVTFLPAPNHMTTLATKPFEYMACGLPVVMSHFDYWKKFFQNHAIYVDPTHSNDINTKLKKLVSNYDLMKQMGECNRQRILNELNWEVESKILFQIYERLLYGRS